MTSWTLTITPPRTGAGGESATLHGTSGDRDGAADQVLAALVGHVETARAAHTYTIHINGHFAGTTNPGSTPGGHPNRHYPFDYLEDLHQACRTAGVGDTPEPARGPGHPVAQPHATPTRKEATP